MKNEMGKDWVMVKHVQKFPRNVKAIPGFRGCYIVISPHEFRTRFDARESTTVCPAGASVVTTSRHDNLVTLATWRCKKNGKEYGSKWVSMQNNKGKKKYFKIEELAAELFSDKWFEVKMKIKSKASQEALGELF